MLTPFVLFFGLTVATAVIAYWSDNLGKKLGKKRISLMGMRPRTTATVLTVASSWGIMLFTLLVMLIVAKPLRDALFRFDREREQNRELRAQRDQLTLQKDTLDGELTNREKRLVQVGKEADKARRDADQQTQTARRAQEAAGKALEEQRLATTREAIARKGERNAKSSEVQAKRGAKEAARRAEAARKGQVSAEREAKLAFADLKGAQEQLEENNQRLDQARSELSDTEKDLSAANRRLTNAQRQLTNAQKQLSNASKKLEFANAELGRIKGSAQNAYKETAEAYKATAEAYRQYSEAQQGRNLAQAQVDALKTQQEELEQRIAGLSRTAQEYAVTVNQLSTRPVLVAVNQTLVARTLPPALSPARVQSHLRSLFALAESVGPRLLPNSKVELLQYVESAGKLVRLPDNEVFSRAADFIAASGREVSVRLVSHSNFAEGEPVIQVRFEIVEVKKAVDAGDVLAQKTIDGKIGDAAIFTSLLDLVEMGRREAVRKGINPPQTPDDPNFYENGTNEQIFAALRQIETSGVPKQVKIIAAEDLSTVEPVRVRFEVS